MRVLHLTRDFPPRSAGGISTAVGGMVRALERESVRCSVVSFDDWRPRASGAVGSVERGHAGSVALLRVTIPAHVPDVHAFVRQAAPDILHVHHGMLWPIADELGRALEIPAILEVHVLQAHQNRLRGLAGDTLSSRAQLDALASAQCIVAPSRAAAQLIASQVPERASRVTTIGLGVDMAAANSTVGPRSCEALYVGRFADINGTRELMHVVPRVLERVPTARFCIAGGLPHNRKAERRWLRRFDDAWTDATRQRVDVRGWLDAAALRDRYLTSGVLVSPSWFESFGLVVLEAMACGMPIAATQVGAVPELVDHGRTGLLSAPRDIDGMVDNVVRLLEQPTFAQALGVAARVAACGRTWQVVAPELAALYRAVAS